MIAASFSAIAAIEALERRITRLTARVRQLEKQRAVTPNIYLMEKARAHGASTREMVATGMSKQTLP